MKKHYVILMLMVSTFATSYAQSTTHYGEGTGTAGYRGSYFGRAAGAALLVEDPAGYRNTDNSFFGSESGMSTTGNSNTGVGSATLSSNTSGSSNVAIGHGSMEDNISGNLNVAVGNTSLKFNTIGNSNTAVGTSALNRNSTGNNNSALGIGSMSANETGSDNVAVGNRALSANIAGNSNTAIGSGALASNTSPLNTAVGHDASHDNTNGLLNASFGAFALRYNTSGSLNSAFGYSAGPSSGSPALANTTALGAMAVPTASHQVRIGNNNVTSIGGRVAWSVLSDGRFKTNVKEDVAGLEFINKLRPVSYYVDNAAINRFMHVPDVGTEDMSSARKADREQGFIAQEVDALVKKSGYVFNGVQTPQNDGDHYSIRYSDFVVPLVKAVQELSALLQQQQKLAQEQQNEIAALKTQLALGSNNASDQFQSAIGAGLSQNSPNPFNVDTHIHMSIPEAARGAVLTIYSMEGKQVKSMPINDRGDTSVKIQGNELAPGIYIYSLMVDGKVLDSKRMILTGN
jgi:trimeric autotransporter adhesin